MAEGGFEIELKLVIERRDLQLSLTADPGSWALLSLPPVVQHLLERYPPLYFEVQHDTYYHHPSIDIAAIDQVLRHRQSILFVRKKNRWQLDGHRDILTWKGPANKSGAVKRREEIEADLSSGMLAILHKLGFTASLEIRKHRWSSVINTITLSLDVVEKLGFFLELEILADEKKGSGAAKLIAEFKEQYSLSIFPEEPRSYARLLQNL